MASKQKQPKIKKVSHIFACQGTWKWTCSICGNKYYKMGSHASCYTRYCIICEFAFANQEELVEHAKLWHPEYYCDKCKNSFFFIKNHKQNDHSKKKKTN